MEEQETVDLPDTTEEEVDEPASQEGQATKAVEPAKPAKEEEDKKEEEDSNIWELLLQTAKEDLAPSTEEEEEEEEVEEEDVSSEQTSWYEEFHEEGSDLEEAEEEVHVTDEEWSSTITSESSYTKVDSKIQLAGDQQSIEDSSSTNSGSELSFTDDSWEAWSEEQEEEEYQAPVKMKKRLLFHTDELVYDRSKFTGRVLVHKASDPPPQEILYMASVVATNQVETDSRKEKKSRAIENIITSMAQDRGGKIKKIMKSRPFVKWNI